MAQKSVAEKPTEAVPSGGRVAPRPRRKTRAHISAGTWIFILVLLGLFAWFNYYYLPRLGQTTVTNTPPPVFQVAQHANLDIVNAQIKGRQSFLTATPQPVPAETGKTNPFE